MHILDKNFLEKLKLIYTEKELEIIKKGFNTKRKTVFRINSCKNGFDVIKELQDLGYKLEKIDFLENAYKILKIGKKRLAETKSFKEGYIYVQGVTSQIPVNLLSLFSGKEPPSPLFRGNKCFSSPDKGNGGVLSILDLTAAPGGKSSQVACRYPNSKIYANELDKIRFEKLSYTIRKQGAQNIELLNMDARTLKDHFEEGFFDVIIADLPCSAEGRIDLQKEKSYKYLEKQGVNKRNYKLQQDILKNSISLLKSGGELIYSTCTLDPLENEGIVHYLLINFPELEICDISAYFDKSGLKEISKPGITSYKKYIFKKEVTKSIRLLPSEISEGFFVAKFRKKAD